MTPRLYAFCKSQNGCFSGADPEEKNRNGDDSLAIHIAPHEPCH